MQGHIGGSQSQLSFMLKHIDIGIPESKYRENDDNGDYDLKQKKVNFDPRMKSSINFGNFERQGLLPSHEDDTDQRSNQIISEGDQMNKTSNDFTREDENSKSNDDFDSSLNRNPLS